jgi:hypothetical protein
VALWLTLLLSPSLLFLSGTVLSLAVMETAFLTSLFLIVRLLHLHAAYLSVTTVSVLVCYDPYYHVSL